MKKIILILVLSLFVGIACNKSSNKTLAPSTNEVWCIYNQLTVSQKTFLYCAKSKEEMQTKVQQYRDNGITVTSEQKTDCNECQ